MQNTDALAAQAAPLEALHVDRIFDEFRDQAASAMSPLFLRYGSAAFKGGFDPRRDEIDHPELRDVFDIYADLAGPDERPIWNEDVPFHFKKFLRNLHVIDFVADNRLRYKVFASAVADYYGRDDTGLALPVEAPSVRVLFHALSLMVAERRQKLYTQHAPPRNSRVLDCQRLFMPFYASTGSVHRLLVAQFPFRQGPDSVALHPLLMR